LLDIKKKKIPVLKIVMQFLETPVCIKEEKFSDGKNHIAINIQSVSSEYKTKFLFGCLSISTENKRTFFNLINEEEIIAGSNNPNCLYFIFTPA
jgi:hypothetical protein